MTRNELQRRRRLAKRNADAMERAAYRRMTTPHDCEALAEPVNLLFGETGMACSQCGALILKEKPNAG